VQSFWKGFLIVLLLTGFAWASRADICAICGKPIYGTEYIVTDKVTGKQLLVCSNCIKLPRCFICGLPVKNGVELPDGRWLCARDAKTAMLNADDIRQTFSEVHDDLDRLFSRFTDFPTNVQVAVIDRIDVDSMYSTEGNSFESPDLLGFTRPENVNGSKEYEIGLLTGLPRAELEETCAHELSHAWVGENVPPERHGRLARDAEEGFCEMVGYLLVESKGEQMEEKRVLANRYTRGQVQLFLEAEQRYGFDEILDWMKYGVTAKLDADNLEEVRDIKIPPQASSTGYVNGNSSAPIPTTPVQSSTPATPPAPTTVELQGIFWGSRPVAIINGCSFSVNDQFAIKLGQTSETIRCLAIQQNSVRIRNVSTGKEQKLSLPAQ
jgi:Protein DA1